MTNLPLQALSLNELHDLQEELRREADFCREVDSLADYAGTRDELHNIADELAARQALLAAMTMPTAPATPAASRSIAS